MPADTPGRPRNLLIVHWHDVGRYLSAYGVPVPSPAVDRLASRATVFEQAYSTAPLCSPARGSLFTGRYPHSNGLMGLSHLGWEYHANERTLPMLFGDAGYDTFLVGMQHESSDASSLGYDEVQSLNAPEQYADAVAALAVNRIRQLDPEQPFAMTVGFFEPHRPWPASLYPPLDPAGMAVPDYLPDTPAVRAELAAFGGAIACADAATGRVLDALAEAGLADDTIVVFTTDHGIAFPGAKSTLHDGGIEVALVIAVPGTPAQRTDRLVSHVDVLPTLLELCGIDIPPTIQGESFADALAAVPALPARDAVYAEKNWHDPSDYDPVRAIRTRHHKLIRSYEERAAVAVPGDIAKGGSVADLGDVTTRRRAPVELYDLAADPAEQHNLADDPALADLRRDLERRLDDFLLATDDPLRHGPIAAPRVAGRLPSAIRGRRRP